MTRPLLTAMALALLATPSSALNLIVATGLSVPGPVSVPAAAWLPGGEPALCLGDRAVVLRTGGAVARQFTTVGPCEQLAVSPDGATLAVKGQGETTVNVYHVTDGTREGTVSLKPGDRFGFLADGRLLTGGMGGLDAVNPATGTRITLNPAPVSNLSVAPDGTRALTIDQSGERPRLLLRSLPDLAVQSAMPCDAPCPPGPVRFSASGRLATVSSGTVLYALRDGYAGTAIVRGSAGVTGLPLRDGTLLTLNGGALETRDFLTGRREAILPVTGVLALPATVSDTERVLAVNGGGELLNTDATFQDVRRVQLPALALDGGLDPTTGTPLLRLADGTLRTGAAAFPGTYWAVQTRNRSTWALRAGTDGGLQLTALSNGFARPLGGRTTHSHLTVNHWGNHAATWNDEQLRVITQTGQATATLTPPPGTLKDASVTLSPDATRVFVFPARADAFLTLVQNGKRFPLPVPAAFRPTGVQISGKGILAYATRTGTVALYRPNTRTPYATLTGQGNLARFSNDSATLALPRQDERGARVDLVNVDTGQVEASTPILATVPGFLTWSADSKRLIVGSGLQDDLNSVTIFELQ